MTPDESLRRAQAEYDAQLPPEEPEADETDPDAEYDRRREARELNRDGWDADDWAADQADRDNDLYGYSY